MHRPWRNRVSSPWPSILLIRAKAAAIRVTLPPDINTEDFSAAVDFLGLQSEVDRNRIGLLGICGWGGMALNDAAMDTRVKAVATSVMYDMSRAMGPWGWRR